MVTCYREKTCRVRLHGEGACSLRFSNDRCPNSQLGDDDETEVLEEEVPSMGQGSDGMCKQP